MVFITWQLKHIKNTIHGSCSVIFQFHDDNSSSFFIFSTFKYEIKHLIWQVKQGCSTRLNNKSVNHPR